jgi:hypothetical protein
LDQIHLRLSCPPFSSSVNSKQCERHGSFTCIQSLNVYMDRPLQKETT